MLRPAIAEQNIEPHDLMSFGRRLGARSLGLFPTAVVRTLAVKEGLLSKHNPFFSR
jgi:hypothetical protein